MYAIERHQKIGEEIGAQGRVTVADLSERFNVTPETVRRDLDLLERQGVLQRVHGGAVAGSKISLAESTVAVRSDKARDSKLVIARAALGMIGESFRGSILIDAGTTTGALAQLLADWSPVGGVSGGHPLTIITNSVPIAAVLHLNPAIELHLLGGSVRGITSAAVGASTIEQLDRLRPDIAFIGTNGVSAAFGLSTPEEREAAVKAAMIRRSRRTVVLADSSKLDEEALYRFAELRDLDTLVSDVDPAGTLSAALDAEGVEVIVP